MLLMVKPEQIPTEKSRAVLGAHSITPGIRRLSHGLVRAAPQSSYLRSERCKGTREAARKAAGGCALPLVCRQEVWAAGEVWGWR